MKSLIRQKPALFAFLVLIALWQALGAFGYMVVLAEHPLAPVFYGAVKIIMLILPFVGVWLGISTLPAFKGWGMKDVLLGLGFGGVFFLVLLAVFSFAPNLFIEASKEALPRAATFGIGTPFTFILAGIIFSFVHSLFEEYYWRWFVFGGLTSFVSTRLAIIVSSVAFSLHHILILLPFISAPLAVIGGGVVGVVGGIWSFLYAKQKNLVAPWISHIAADLAIVYVIYQILFL